MESIMLNPLDVEYVEFDLSTRCNARCPLCYRNYKVFREHYPRDFERPLEDICKQILEFPSLKWIYVVGSISEPTLHSRFLDLVRFIKGRGILIELCTNGSTRTESFWKELGALLTEEDKVYFTICGSTQEVHEVYRRGTRLEKILENARALRSVRKCDYAQCIRFAYNSADFDSDRFKKMVSEFSYVYWTETFIAQDPSVYREQVNWELFKPCHNKFDPIKELAKTVDKISHRCDCESLKYNKVQVDVYGNVYPCYLYLEASKGRLWNRNYSDIINGKCSVCKYCSAPIKRYLVKHGLEDIV